MAPVDLAPRANLSLVQGLLARADRVTIDVIGNAVPIVRRAKLRGLIVNVAHADETTRMTISGPLALFHHSRLYGRALGSIVPLLAWSTRFVLEARCHLDEGDKMLRVVSGEYIARKLAAYNTVGVSNLVLCIDERHRCADGELPQGVRVVWFRKRVDPAAVLEAIGETFVDHEVATGSTTMRPSAERIS